MPKRNDQDIGAINLKEDYIFFNFKYSSFDINPKACNLLIFLTFTILRNYKEVSFSLLNKPFYH